MCLKKELRARPKTWKILELVVEDTFNSYAKNVRHLRRNSPLLGFATFGGIGGRLLDY
jgi:hypothetical protein